MTWLLWVAGLGLFGVAAGGILWAVTRTDYLPRLGVWLARTAWKALKPILLAASPETIERGKKESREGGKRKDGGR